MKIVLLEYLNTFVHLLCMHTKPRGGSRQGSKCSGGSLKHNVKTAVLY